MFMMRSKIMFPLINLPLKNLSQSHFSGKQCLIMHDLSFALMGSMAFWFFLICYLSWYFFWGELDVVFHSFYIVLAYVVQHIFKDLWLIEKIKWRKARKLPRSSHLFCLLDELECRVMISLFLDYPTKIPLFLRWNIVVH